MAIELTDNQRLDAEWTRITANVEQTQTALDDAGPAGTDRFLLAEQTHDAAQVEMRTFYNYWHGVGEMTGAIVGPMMIKQGA